MAAAVIAGSYIVALPTILDLTVPGTIGVSLPVPADVSTHIVTGLVPNGVYAVTMSGGNVILAKDGAGATIITADAASVAYF